MDKSKQHYERIQSKKKRDKENQQMALEKEFNSAMKTAEKIASALKKVGEKNGKQLL